ncbi:MAG: hypothetical protein NZ551_07660 [Microscillaceae bacterium]|nr:hypothetical protein [Microscillaceae bacterium]MDW8461072.1 hypothetical protein [Cytophagales bacterium]
MHKNIQHTCFYISFLLCIKVGYSQHILAQHWQIWKTLAQVQFKTIQKQGKEIDIPVFSAELQKLEGKEIYITGYLIPLEETNRQDYFVLSAYPYNDCYFCGGAGIETVIEVYAQEKIPYSRKPISLKGILKLNTQNSENLLFMLKNATLLAK